MISSSRSNQRYLNDKWLPLTVFSQRNEDANSGKANSRILVVEQIDEWRNSRPQQLMELDSTSSSAAFIWYTAATHNI
jgi:hypothetical protein